MELLSSASYTLATQPLPPSEALLMEQFIFWINFEQISGFFFYMKKGCLYSATASTGASASGR